jgi:hypothetical protein
MTYAVKDKSVHSGAPIECYEFVASHKTWYLTSYHEQITVAGKVFSPIPITRTAIETGNVIDTPTTMDFNIPAQHELAITFCFTVSPKTLGVTVYRVHEGDDYSTDYKIEYSGELAGSSASGSWGTIKTASKLQTRLNGNLSSVYYQKTCNHTLYDARCKVNRSSFTVTANVVKVQSQIITVDDMVFPASGLVAGEMTNTRTGEKQGIIANTSNVIKLGYRFFDILVGDVVELTQGCDHMRLGHCKNRFNNVPNYGGMDFIPEVNPFEQLNYQTTTSTTTTVRKEQQDKLSFPSLPESG